jgi:hypothetical protein
LLQLLKILQEVPAIEISPNFVGFTLINLSFGCVPCLPAFDDMKKKILFGVVKKKLTILESSLAFFYY